jgi:acid phosphatase family membrane protein YuiD
MNEFLQLAIAAVKGLTVSAVFVLALFIGFCVIVGFTKTKKTAGGAAAVVKSLDERLTHQPMAYLPPNAPRGHADPLEGFGTRRGGPT